VFFIPDRGRLTINRRSLAARIDLRSQSRLGRRRPYFQLRNRTVSWHGAPCLARLARAGFAFFVLALTIAERVFKCSRAFGLLIIVLDPPVAKWRAATRFSSALKQQETGE
jgi:hypothetical protein